jgi:hypothetical protein
MTVLDRIRAGACLSELDASERLVLAALTVLGAALRVWYQHDRPWFGDEVGTLLYMRESPGFILSNFGTWISMNYFILIEKALALALGSGPWALTALPLAASVCTIPLTVALALKFSSHRAALIAGALAASNAYLVEFGPVIRSYSLLAALALVSVLLFVRWHARPTWGRAALCASAATAICLMHLVGVYVWIGLGSLAVASWVARARAGGSGGRILAEARMLGIPFLVAGTVLVLAHLRLYPGMSATNAQWTERPPGGIGYLPQVFRTYFGGGRLGLATALFLALGTWAALREKRQLFVLPFLALVPVAAMSLQGVAVFDWAFARYLVFTVPFLVVLAAEGIDLASRAVAEPRGAWLGWGLAALLVATWIPPLQSRFDRKHYLPWPALARHLASLPPGTAIVATSSRDHLHLQPFSMESGREVVELSEFLDADAAPERGGIEIVYVNSYEPIRTDAPATRFGSIQVVAYAADTKRALVRKLHDDLILTTRERIGQRLKPHYESLVESSRFLGLRDEVDRFRELKNSSHRSKARAQFRQGLEEDELELDDLPISR